MECVSCMSAFNRVHTFHILGEFVCYLFCVILFVTWQPFSERIKKTHVSPFVEISRPVQSQELRPRFHIPHCLCTFSIFFSILDSIFLFLFYPFIYMFYFLINWSVYLNGDNYIPVTD